MALELLQTALQTAEARALVWRMSLDAWTTEQQEIADKVAVYRRYADGDHDANLTSEMKDMLRIGASDFDRFNDNYMGIVIDTLVDRLQVARFDTGNDAANAWVTDLLAANRFDALQTDVHEAAIRDGNTYVLVSWDNAARRVVITHEPAYDGTNGMLVRHDPANRVQVGLKVWQEGDLTRYTLYYADHVERYVSHGLGTFTPFETSDGPARASWTVNQMPVVHFPNRGTTWNAYGVSEIENAIPLQNALNRTLYSMVMNSELGAFLIRVAIGFDPPAGLTPGMWLKISPNAPLTPDQKVEASVLEQGEIVPYIQQAQWLTSEIGKITRTPAPEFMGGDNASGESLKQREIGLLGKVQRFQVKAGNRWEDVIRLAAQVQTTFGSAPPAFDRLTCQWASAELRNDTEVVANAKVLADMGYETEALRQMAGVFGWDDAKIQQLLNEKAASEQAKIGAIASALPGFGAVSFGLPTGGQD